MASCNCRRRSMARSGRESLLLSGAEIRSAWRFFVAFPARVWRLLCFLLREDRRRLLLMLAGLALTAAALSFLGAGRTEVWDIVVTLVLAVLVWLLSRDHRTVGAVVIAVLTLSLVGTLAGPRWSPVAFDRSMLPSTPDTRIGGEIATDPVGSYAVDTVTVTIAQSGGRSVQALLRQPRGVDTPTRAVVFLHGAGTHSQEGFAQQAQELASAGITTLVPDKPTEDYTLTARNYVSMAADYARSVDFLRSLSSVDPHQVGIYAESEGYYPGLVLAGRDRDIAFVVLVSAPVVMLRQQASYATATYLRAVGVPDALLTGAGRLLGSRRLPGEAFRYADFDPAPYARRIHAPVLMMYGTADSSMPLVQGPTTVAQWLSRAGNSDLTVRYYSQANHGLKSGHSTDGRLVPGVTRDLARWIGGLPTTSHAPPAVAGATPVQDFMAAAPGKTRWYASGDLMLGTIVAGWLLLCAAGLVWLAGQTPRLVGRRGVHLPDPIGRWSVGLALSILASWVMYLAYIMMVASLALSYRSNPWISYGGWLVAQGQALATVVLAVKLVSRVWTMRGHLRRDGGGVWLTFSSASILVMVLAATVVLLVDLAYWGLFPMLT